MSDESAAVEPASTPDGELDELRRRLAESEAEKEVLEIRLKKAAAEHKSWLKTLDRELTQARETITAQADRIGNLEGLEADATRRQKAGMAALAERAEEMEQLCANLATAEADLTAAVAARESAEDTLQASTAEYEARLYAVGEVLKRAGAEMEAQRTRLAERDADLQTAATHGQTLQQALESRTAEVERLSAEVAAATAAKAEFERRLGAATATLEARIAGLTGELGAARAEGADQLTRIGELESRLDASEARERDLADAVSERGAELASATAAYQSLETAKFEQSAGDQARIDDLEQHRRAAEIRETELRAALVERAAELSAAVAAHQALESAASGQAESDRTRIGDLEQLLAASETREQYLQAALAERGAELAAAVAAHQALEADSANRAASYQARIGDLENLLNDAEVRERDLATAVAERGAGLAAAAAAYQTLESVTSGQAASDRARIDGLEQQILAGEARERDLGSALAARDAELAAAVAARQAQEFAASEQAASARTRIDGLEQQILAGEARERDLGRTLAERGAELVSAAAAHQALQLASAEQAAESQTRIGELEKALEQARSAIAALSDRLSQLEQRSAAELAEARVAHETLEGELKGIAGDFDTHLVSVGELLDQAWQDVNARHARIVELETALAAAGTRGSGLEAAVAESEAYIGQLVEELERRGPSGSPRAVGTAFRDMVRHAHAVRLERLAATEPWRLPHDYPR
ncbi:MAG: hypothetical protein GC191_01935 [Azospirillum sp.]|nr:hypothetical protein [Azospirillum sp.]